MKLMSLLEAAPPALLRREALELQQELIEMGWDDVDMKFEASNAGYPCAVLKATRNDEAPLTGKYITDKYRQAKTLVAAGYFRETEPGHPGFVAWEDPVDNVYCDLGEFIYSIKNTYVGAYNG